MKRAASLLVLAVLAVLAGSRAGADTGPVKHWATFPGREVRAVSFRGDLMGAEPSYRAVAGRDGRTYLRGRFGLYRLLGDDGRYEKVDDTAQCSGWAESHGADTLMSTPAALCSRASTIIVAMPTWHKHVPTPAPHGPSAFRVMGKYRFDERYVTDVVADAGGYWFLYGAAGAYGYVSRSGTAASSWDIPDSAATRWRGGIEWQAFGHAGDDAYVLATCSGVRVDRRTRRAIRDGRARLIGMHDGRDRIWIGAALIHAAAVVSP